MSSPSELLLRCETKNTCFSRPQRSVGIGKAAQRPAGQYLVHCYSCAEQVGPHMLSAQLLALIRRSCGQYAFACDRRRPYISQSRQGSPLRPRPPTLNDFGAIFTRGQMITLVLVKYRTVTLSVLYRAVSLDGRMRILVISVEDKVRWSLLFSSLLLSGLNFRGRD